MAQNAAEKLASERISGAAATARPFLKWAGGKGQLVPEIKKRFPSQFSRYYEPFVGGGALLFAVRPEQACISDINAELINAYLVVKNQVEDLIKDLERHVYARDYFYKMRDADRGAEFKDWTRVQRASRLIYLNKTCYNGLYRVNSSGYFNTPFGKYSRPKIVDAQNLRACSRALAPVSIRRASFELVQKLARPKDFVYFDPPYMPVSATANFTNYSKVGFDISAQRALCELCCRLDQKGVFFLLSNSGTKAVRELYRGFRQEQVWATRAVNSVASKRGAIKELLIRNY